MDRRHEALLNREVVVQDLRERRDAVRRTGGVRDDVVLFGVVHVVVDSENDRYVRIRGRRGDDDLFRAGVDVLLSAFAVGEETRRLDHELHFKVPPGQTRWVFLGQNLKFALAGPDYSVTDLDVLAELPEDGVVLQEVPHRLRVAEIVDRDDLEIPAALEVRAEEVAPDAPESVDTHACLSHGASLVEAL